MAIRHSRSIGLRRRRVSPSHSAHDIAAGLRRQCVGAMGAMAAGRCRHAEPSQPGPAGVGCKRCHRCALSCEVPRSLCRRPLAGEKVAVGTLKITVYYHFWLLELTPGHFGRSALGMLVLNPTHAMKFRDQDLDFFSAGTGWLALGCADCRLTRA